MLEDKESEARVDLVGMVVLFSNAVLICTTGEPIALASRIGRSEKGDAEEGRHRRCRLRRSTITCKGPGRRREPETANLPLRGPSPPLSKDGPQPIDLCRLCPDACSSASLSDFDKHHLVVIVSTTQGLLQCPGSSQRTRKDNVAEDARSDTELTSLTLLFMPVRFGVAGDQQVRRLHRRLDRYECW